MKLRSGDIFVLYKVAKQTLCGQGALKKMIVKFIKNCKKLYYVKFLIPLNILEQA